MIDATGELFMKFNRLVVCGLLVFLMIGCGSGSGGSSSVDFSDATSQGSSGSNPSKSISGTASKGILIDATVTIVELDLDGNTLNIVGGPVNTDSSVITPLRSMNFMQMVRSKS